MSNLERDPAETVCVAGAPQGPTHELLVGCDVPLGKHTVVSRTLPHRDRRMIGTWCFVDHFGPDAMFSMPGMRVPPHPHTGLQTVTWLLDGAVEHRDTLGTVQTITPGALNLMTAGRGIAHSEESPADRPPTLHGVQLWIALPAVDAQVDPRFEHVTDLPRLAGADLPGHGLPGHGLDVTVLVGEVAGAESPARVHTPIVGADVVLGAGADGALPVEAAFEHAVLVTAGQVEVDGEVVSTGGLLYLGTGRSGLSLRATDAARAILLGGEPFEEEIVMWWNFVGRSHEDVVAARDDWQAGRRFGVVHGFDGDPLPAPELPAVRLRARGRHRGRQG